MSTTEPLSVEFGWMRLDGSSITELRKIESCGTMAGHGGAVSDKGEIFHLTIANPLKVSHLMPNQNDDSEPSLARLSDEESLLPSSSPLTNLFPERGNWPSALEKLLEKYLPKMLSLSVKLNQHAAAAMLPRESGQMAAVEQDVYIHVFLNGIPCDARLVTSESLRKLSGGYHEEVFHGIRSGDKTERIWVVGDKTAVNEQEKLTQESWAQLRWLAFNMALTSAVNHRDASPTTRFLSKYVSVLANQPAPQQILTGLDAEYAVIDVILVGGSEKKASKRGRESSVDAEVCTDLLSEKKRKTPAQASLTVYQNTTSPADAVAMNTQDTLDGPVQPADFDDLYDDSDDDAGKAPKAKAPSPRNEDSLMRAVTSQRQSPVSFSKARNNDSDQGEVEVLGGATRAPETGHISNLLHLKRREERAVRGVAQHVKPKRPRWKHHRVIKSNTSVASLHRSTISKSPGSGPSESVEWSSSSSEVIRSRKIKGDLSLPRKPRRKVRYQSSDFDSEDPVATIPGASGSKIRILEPNIKTDLPLHVEPQQEPNEVASQLVKQPIERNLRRKRQRQFFKRTIDVGLTEQDMENFIEADYDARDGIKPWLESLDHAEVPLTQAVVQQADRTDVSNTSTEMEEISDGVWDEQMLESFLEEYLLQGSAVTVRDDLVGVSPEIKPDNFDSQKVLRGLRFIFV